MKKRGEKKKKVKRKEKLKKKKKKRRKKGKKLPAFPNPERALKFLSSTLNLTRVTAIKKLPSPETEEAFPPISKLSARRIQGEGE